MACINLIGLAGVEFLRRPRGRADPRAPRHVRRDQPLRPARVSRSAPGRSSPGSAGVDHLHTNGISNKFYESDAEVLDSIAAVREPLLGQTPTVPVLSSGQWAGLAHATYAAVGTTDLLVLAGGGIHGHPDGPAAGVESMRDGVGVGRARARPSTSALAASPAFRRATETFGPAACLTCAVAFYGDDFTGQRRRAAAVRARAGWRAGCCSGIRRPTTSSAPPTASTWSASPGSPARCRPSEIEAEVRPALEALAALGPQVVQYKACSTADSSPDSRQPRPRHRDRRATCSAARPCPVLFAQPDFGRFTAFGHHFAAEGGVVYRLDRQPTMSTAPVDADARVRPGACTSRDRPTCRSGSMPFTAYGDDPAEFGGGSTRHPRRRSCSTPSPTTTSRSRPRRSRRMPRPAAALRDRLRRAQHGARAGARTADGRRGCRGSTAERRRTGARGVGQPLAADRQAGRGRSERLGGR